MDVIKREKIFYDTWTDLHEKKSRIVKLKKKCAEQKKQ